MERTKIADIKREYPLNLRWGIIGALLFCIALFTLCPSKLNIKGYVSTKSTEMRSEEINLKSEELTPPPPEAKVAVPVEAESEAEVEAATTGQTEFKEVYTSPETQVEIPIVPYYKLEKRPEPKYTPDPVYPDRSRINGEQGTVIVKVLVGADGTIEQAELAKALPYPLLNNAALEAALKWTFTPAQQQGRPVRVWVSVPIIFTLD